MLDLPDGTVLFSASQSQLYVYQPDGNPLASGQPTITSIAANSDGSYTLVGTLLNGISQGAAYGDDAQMNSNYPLIRLTDAAGNVFYARSYNWSSTGVMTGTKPVYTQFDTSTVPAGTYSLVVIANGISSAPVQFAARGIPSLATIGTAVTGGNGNGMIDPNECNNLTVTLTNTGGSAAVAVQGTLYSLTPNVYIGQATASFSTVQPGSSAANLNPFTISTQPSFLCGTPVNLMLVLQDEQGFQTNFFQIATGVLGPPVEFDNSTAVAVPGGGLTGNVSPINVQGIGTVGKVTVSVYLPALEDEFMVLELIAPDGTSAILADADGGVGANFGSACSPSASRTTFDDAASQSINSGSAPLVGTYTPFTPLAAFNGVNGNGVWQLYVINELSNNTATLDCWSLFISAQQCADGGGTCPGSDLSLTMSADPISTVVGTPVFLNLTASNAGPSIATNVVVIQSLPPGLQYLSSTLSQGTVFLSGTNLNFSLGTLDIESNATISVEVVPASTGLLSSVATIGSPAPDSNPTNNTASASVLVTKPQADLAVAMSASASFVPVEGQVTFNVFVTNNGPATAVGVTLTNFLPANAKLVSETASQGSLSSAGTLAFIGTLSPGTGAKIVLVLSPSAVGNVILTSSAGLSTNLTDPNTRNNTASVTVTAVPSADLAISLAVNPSPSIAGSNFTYAITVTNAGPDTATAVVMTQTLPPSATFVSTSQSSASQSGGVVTWNIGTMLPGTSQLLTNILRSPGIVQGVSSNVLVTQATVAGQPSDPNTANNTIVVSTVDLPPEVLIVPGAVVLPPPLLAVTPGQTVVVQLGLQNIGNIPTVNLVATLQPTAGVIPSPLPQFGPQTYGALAAGGGTGTGQFSFTVNSTNGGTIVATLQLQDGANNLGTANFTFNLPNVTTVWNNALISVPATNYLLAPYNASGPAGPYPSSIFVSGVTSYVANVSVTVSNLYHSYPSDIELLLVGPGGQSSVLMSDAAQQTTMSSPATITFDQTAPTALQASAALASGSFRPGQFNTPVFTNVAGATPPPPAGPYPANLSVFSGQSPNGLWQLYAYDSTEGDFGVISNGWAVNIATVTPLSPVEDLGVGVTASPSQLFIGGNVTFNISVTNFSTNAANVWLTNRLSSGLSFASGNSPAPTGQSGQTEYYNLGTLAGQGTFALSITASAGSAGAQGDSVSIGSSLTDPNTNNNLATAAITVVLPQADLSAGINAASGTNAIRSGSQVVVGTNVVYTLSLTNNGPNAALNVVGSLTQSTANSTNIVLTAPFGVINPGATASATFTNPPAAAGYLTNTWTVSTTSSDTNSTNNSAMLPAILATAPEPIIVASGVRLLAESFSPPDGAIDSNETVTIAFSLANVGPVATTNLLATLQSTNGVTPITSSQTYGVVNPGSSGAQSFQLIGRGAPGATITAVLVLTDGSYALGSVSNSFTIPGTTNFANTGRITIPQFGAATPYPSGIAVSGLNGIVNKATVSLQGFTHPFPQDVAVLLTSPSGQQAVLMTHTGGAYSVTNLVLNFDQNAAQPLSAGLLTSGTNLPTLLGAPDIFPAISGTPVNTNLNVLNGINPNGVWSLYVYDDTPGNGGSIASGWTLTLNVVNPVNPPGTLGLGLTHSPDPVIAGNLLLFNLTVTNLSGAPSGYVTLTDTLPPGAALRSATSSQGTVNTNVPGQVTFNIGNLPTNGATATASLLVLPLRPGLITNSASAASPSGTPVTAANSVVVTNLSAFSLTAIPAGASVTLTLTTTPGQTGQNYIIQSSTDLENWTGLATNTATGAGQFSVTALLTNGPEQFFRALHLPQ
jgi:uncharacterized repeat protein (TIGR01451 family)